MDRTRVLTVLAFGFLLFQAATPAEPDSPVTGRYATGDRFRDVYFDRSVPTKGKFRIGVAKASGIWNKLPNVADFEVHTSPTMAISTNPCATINDAFFGGIFWGPLPGSGTLAENLSCVNTETGQLVGFRQTYNTRFDFYTGKGAPPADQYDLDGVATHELGHALGWTGDHYSDRNNSGFCANKAKQATMCPVIYPGTNRLRSLAKNDRKAMLDAYSQPPIAPVSVLIALGLRAPPVQASAVAPGGAGARGCLAGLLQAHLSRGGDDFAGGDGRQLVNLAGGSDIGFGKGGDDCVVGGAGSDDLRPGPGHDTIIGGPGPDIIVGGPGNDLILGTRGPDQIYALDGFFDRIRCGSDDLRDDPAGERPDPVGDSVFTADPNDVLIDCEMAPSDFPFIPLPPGYEK